VASGGNNPAPAGGVSVKTAAKTVKVFTVNMTAKAVQLNAKAARFDATMLKLQTKA